MTYNEAKSIARCLDSVPFAAEKLVIDSGSTDDTVAMRAGARRAGGASGLAGLRPAAQFRYAPRCSHDWILALDADEFLSPELAAELEQRLPRADGQRDQRRRPAPLAPSTWAHRCAGTGRRSARRWPACTTATAPAGPMPACMNRCASMAPRCTLNGAFNHVNNPSLVEKQLKVLRYAELKCRDWLRQGQAGAHVADAVRLPARLHQGLCFPPGHVRRLARLRRSPRPPPPMPSTSACATTKCATTPPRCETAADGPDPSRHSIDDQAARALPALRLRALRAGHPASRCRTPSAPAATRRPGSSTAPAPRTWSKASGCSACEEVRAGSRCAVITSSNAVPHFFPGVKVETFHGFDAGKPRHIYIRGFFDLYCTTGPRDTAQFQAIADRARPFRRGGNRLAQARSVHARDQPARCRPCASRR